MYLSTYSNLKIDAWKWKLQSNTFQHFCVSCLPKCLKVIQKKDEAYHKQAGETWNAIC